LSPQIPLWFELISHPFHHIFTLFFTLLHSTAWRTTTIVVSCKRGLIFLTARFRKHLPFPMSSAMPRRSIAGPVPHQHYALGLSFNHLQLSRSILSHINIHRIHTLHLQSVVHRMEMLLHRIHTIHLHYIATHHIHTLLPPTGDSSGGPASQPYTYAPPPAYPYPPPQPVRSGGVDNLCDGENTSHTTQAHSRTKE
jgi:hypothetical protein